MSSEPLLDTSAVIAHTKDPSECCKRQFSGRTGGGGTCSLQREAKMIARAGHDTWGPKVAHAELSVNKTECMIYMWPERKSEPG